MSWQPKLLIDLGSFITLTIRIDGRLRECRREKRSDSGPNRSLRDPTLQLMNSGDPRRLRSREDPSSPESRQEPLETANSPLPVPMCTRSAGDSLALPSCIGSGRGESAVSGGSWRDLGKLGSSRGCRHRGLPEFIRWKGDP